MLGPRKPAAPHPAPPERPRAAAPAPEAAPAALRLSLAARPPAGARTGAGDAAPVVRRKCAQCAAAEELERRSGVPQPRCAACEAGAPEDAGGTVTRRAADGPAGAAPGAADAVRGVVGSGGGRPLDASTRAFFEAGFGRGFGGVRVHTGARADGSARALGALAYTLGRDVVFRDGRFSPGSAEGRRLLAHELAHVAQQDAGGGERVAAAPDRALAVGSADDPLEREADAAAEAVLAARTPAAPTPDAGGAVRRQETAEAAPAPPSAGAEPPSGGRVGEESATFAAFFSRQPEVARRVELLSAQYRVLIRNLDPVLEEAGVYRRGGPDVPAQRTLRRAVFELEDRISRENLYEPGTLSEWLETLREALRRLRALLVMLGEGADSGADFWEEDRARLAGEADSLAGTPYMRGGAELREQRAAAARQRARIEAAVEFLAEHTRRHWRRDAADIVMGMFGTEAAAKLVHEHHLSGEEIRLVFDRLEEIDPGLLEAALYRGRTVQTLLELGIGGFQAYYAEGEGFLAGAIRAGDEAALAEAPGSRTFSTLERVEVVAGFTAGVFQGIGDSIIGNVRGVVELFTPGFWGEIYTFLTDFLPEFATSAQFRFAIGQTAGIAAAAEDRRLATADPLEYGRTLGQLFGFALTEIVLSFVGLGWILRTVQGAARLAGVAEPLAALARRIGRSAVAARGIQVARWMGESIQAMSARIAAIRRRLPALTAEGRVQRALAEMEEVDRRAAELSRRAAELEAKARRALALGDYPAAQRHLDELSRIADELESGASGAAAAGRRTETLGVGNGIEPHEMAVLDRTRPRAGRELTPAELQAELDIVRRRFAAAPDADEVRLPNDHTWEHRPDGAFCRHSSERFCVLPGLSPGQNSRLAPLLDELDELGIPMRGDDALGRYFSHYQNPDDALADMRRLVDGERARHLAAAPAVPLTVPAGWPAELAAEIGRAAQRGDPVVVDMLERAMLLPAPQGEDRARRIVEWARTAPEVPREVRPGAFFDEGGTSEVFRVEGRPDLLMKTGGGRLPAEARSLIEIEMLGIPTVYAGTTRAAGRTGIVVRAVDGVSSKNIIGRLSDPFRPPRNTGVVTQRTIDDLREIYAILDANDANVGDFQFIVRRSDGAVFVNDPVSFTIGSGPSGAVQSIIERFERILRLRREAGEL